MRLEEVPVEHAVGAVLAHTLRVRKGTSWKKGRTLAEADVRALAAEGVPRVTVARLEADDLGEDVAARRVADAIAGANLEVAPAATGRANVFAKKRGVLVVDRAGVDAVNAVDERITLATRQPFAVAAAGEMVATVKIIPFAVPRPLVERASPPEPVLKVAPFVPKRAGLVLTELGEIPREALDRAAESQRRRMAYLDGEIAAEQRVAHDAGSVARAIASMPELDLILVLGASAIIDREDVVPRGIEMAGGTVDHLGMPVDPGNLLLLGHRGAVPIVGVPGCARSLKPSGFDWILERLAANIPVTPGDITRLGAGGLLHELPQRPSPRQEEGMREPARVAAVVLAAGMSRRMGGPNKLLADVAGRPMIARVVDALLGSRARPVLVVLGHQAEQVRAALAGRDVRFVVNPAYGEGLGASLRAGIEALEGADVDGSLVVLGDMPWVRPEHVERVLDAFDPRGPLSIVVPVHDRKRGHPVLWSARHFAEMRKLAGDVGARALLEEHAGAVCSVPVDDPAILRDVDSPDMLGKGSDE